MEMKVDLLRFQNLPYLLHLVRIGTLDEQNSMRGAGGLQTRVRELVLN